MNERFSLFDFSAGGSIRKFMPYALLTVAVFALYSSALRFEFVWDDLLYVVQNYRIQGLAWPQIRAVWTRTFLGHYAPIHHTFLAVVYFFSKLNPWGYHLAQLLVHASCVCLVYLLVSKLESPRVAMLAALLFVVHPTNVETVAWISESKSTVAFLFFLLSFLSFIRFRKTERAGYAILCAVLLMISMLAKINTVVAPAIFLAYDYKERRVWRAKEVTGIACFFLVSALFVAIHLASFYKTGDVPEGATYYGGPGVHLLNVPLFILFYIRMVIAPYPLSAWHLFAVYDKPNAALVIAWLAILGLAWLFLRANRSVQFWGAWFLIFLAPVLQILPFGIWVADRYLYIPAIGAFVLAAKGLFAVEDRWEAGLRAAAIEATALAVVLGFSVYTYHHLPVWRSDLSLWKATTPTCATSAYCHCNLGLAFLKSGDVDDGMRELIRSVNIRPTPRYLIYLGDAYTLSAKDYRQALIAYQMALENPDREINAQFYAKLARLYVLRRDWDAANAALAAGRRINPNEPALFLADGFLRWKQGDLRNTISAIQAAMSMTGQTSMSQAASLVYASWGDADEVGKFFVAWRSAASSQAANS